MDGVLRLLPADACDALTSSGSQPIGPKSENCSSIRTSRSHPTCGEWCGWRLRPFVAESPRSLNSSHSGKSLFASAFSTRARNTIGGELIVERSTSRLNIKPACHPPDEPLATQTPRVGHPRLARKIGQCLRHTPSCAFGRSLCLPEGTLHCEQYRPTLHRSPAKLSRSALPLQPRRIHDSDSESPAGEALKRPHGIVVDLRLRLPVVPNHVEFATSPPDSDSVESPASRPSWLRIADCFVQLRTSTGGLWNCGFVKSGRRNRSRTANPNGGFRLETKHQCGSARWQRAAPRSLVPFAHRPQQRRQSAPVGFRRARRSATDSAAAERPTLGQHARHVREQVDESGVAARARDRERALTVGRAHEGLGHGGQEVPEGSLAGLL